MGRASLQPGVLSGNTYQLTEIVEFLGQRAQFSHYFWNNEALVNQAFVVPDAGEIFTYWQTQVLPVLRPVLSVGTKLLQLRCWCLNWPDIATQIFGQNALLGTSPGDPLPPQVAYVLSKQTLLRGKSGRGRMYLCGMSEDDSTNGAPTNPFLANAAALVPKLLNNFLGPVTGRTYSHVVVALQQYNKDAVIPAVPPALPQPKAPPLTVHGTVIKAVALPIIWNTQRTRTIGKGQ